MSEEDCKIIEKLIDKNKYLKEDECTVISYNDVQTIAVLYDIYKNCEDGILYGFIKRSKIEKKIKELGNMLQETAQGKLQKYTPKEICCFIEVLRELLESEENK